KLLEKERDITKIYDLVAIRVVVENVHDCYAVLGLIHERWKPLRGRIKDYIAVPKPNGYQSLHTTVFCERDIVEFQVRTHQMHQEAEYGIAAHWNYVESGKPRTGGVVSKEKLAWLNQLVKLQEQVHDERQYLESLKIDVFQNRIFVFTPKGDVLDLPEDSTPVDFAYHIHSDIGNKCASAKVNDKIAPLHATLKSGDIVEIFIDEHRKGPSRDWLDFVKTNNAKQHIRSWLKKHEKDTLIKQTS
ncbi:MAG: bifunctional (p)ppGpp synthetase/guanosine-3',5'-bis(diphosphate) 3'-pyrophosphohydrolase, partial [Candidatus Kerfeldbacteria bacterium]|nr:bifunctional (p)ppGpp synthetase/guanosine-3',5'-bis(diphosphate) 3'-pyrophosphohydrolase [Candidatus Kerfeldbacteria bacterium]